MNMRVIVTRPRQEAGKWVDALAHAGYQAVALPLIDVLPAPDAQAVADAWGRLHTYDAVMFVSSNAVEHFFASKAALAHVFTTQSAIKTRAFVPGPGSFAALLRRQAEAQCIDAPEVAAGQFDSEALWKVVGPRVHAGYRVLIVRGAGPAAGAAGDGRGWFANQVRAAGGTVEFVVAYRRRPPQLSEQALQCARQGAVDGSVWLFSSSQAIANLVRACPGQSWAQARAVVTHHRIALAARQAGFAVVEESRPELPALIASIESLK